MREPHKMPSAVSGKEQLLIRDLTVKGSGLAKNWAFTVTRPARSDDEPERAKHEDRPLHQPVRWTRRQTLATFSATLAMLPITATTQPLLPPALAEACLRAVASPFSRRLGEVAAAGRQISELASTLMARLGPVTGSGWPAALCESGRRDIARGDIVEILGHPVMRTETETLALGVLLLRARTPSDALTS